MSDCSFCNTIEGWTEQLKRGSQTPITRPQMNYLLYLFDGYTREQRMDVLEVCFGKALGTIDSSKDLTKEAAIKLINLITSEGELSAPGERFIHEALKHVGGCYRDGQQSFGI